jgi:hypothetical protein
MAALLPEPDNRRRLYASPNRDFRPECQFLGPS